MGLFDGLGGSAAGLLAQDVGLAGAISGSQNMAASQYNQLLNAQQNAYNAASQRRVQAGPQAPVKPFNPNEIEAYQIPLSQLVTLWQAKYGDKWVELREVSDTEFFGHAADRLVRNALMEECRNWMRIKEGV